MRLKPKIAFWFTNLVFLIKSEVTTIDKSLGIIKTDNFNAILIDGVLTFKNEIGLKIPSIEGDGTCNHLHSIHKKHNSLAPNIANPQSPTHKNELNLMSSVATGLLEDINKDLVRKITRRLGFKEGTLHYEDVIKEFKEKGISLCYEENVHCEFALPISVHQSCITSTGSNLPVGYVFGYKEKLK